MALSIKFRPTMSNADFRRMMRDMFIMRNFTSWETRIHSLYNTKYSYWYGEREFTAACTAALIAMRDDDMTPERVADVFRMTLMLYSNPVE